MFDISVFAAAMWTAATSISIVIIFFAHRYMLEIKKETLTNKMIFVSFMGLMTIIGGAIVFILLLWGYDVSDWFMGIGTDFSTLLEENVPRLIGTLIALFIALMILKVSKLSLQRVGRKNSVNQRRKKTIANVTMSIIKYIIVIVSFLTVLSIWGMNVAPALAGLGIMGLVIGLGAQKFINDLISGFFIIFEHHFDVGDWIEVQGFMGEVTDIGLKTTKVKNFKGELKIFNNGSIDPVSNFSRNESLAIADFGIAYKEDVARTTELLKKELPKLREDVIQLLEDPRVLGVIKLNDSGVDLRVVCRVETMTQWHCERMLRQRIKEILDTNGIEIPFPQLTLHYATKKEKEYTTQSDNVNENVNENVKEKE